MTGFKDFGATGETGPGLEAGGSKLKVKPLSLAAGNLTGLVTMWPCAVCGESKKKPFCDDSHKAAGFCSD